MNKGLKLRFCKECNRKRYCSKVSIPSYNFRITCSKGHSWIIEGITIERINAALSDAINKNTLENLFNRTDTFYTTFKK